MISKTSKLNKVKNDKGLTLIEILIVIAILTLVLSLSLIFSMDDYRGYSFRDERNKIIGILEKARSQAINNICLDATCDNGTAHGVHIVNNTLTLFEGDSWASRHSSIDESFEVSKTISISGISEVIFSQLSGDGTTTPKTISDIVLTDISGRTSIININTEGNISWTN
jgi:prepilin-type N-terminal cleavage/methylation domain-containing protein